MMGVRETAIAIGRELADRGKLIEAGWAVFAHAVLPPDVSNAQRDDMQFAFMAGADHVFTTILNIMDEGDDPTEDDLRRMDKIHTEIDQWRARLSERVNRGRAP